MRTRYWFLLVLVVIGAVGLGIYGIKKWKSNRPVTLAESERIAVTDVTRLELVDENGNAKGFGPEEIQGGLDYMLTDEYANLSEDAKQQYREQLADSYNASMPEMGVFRGGTDLLDPTDEEYTEGQQTYLESEVAKVHEIADERAADQEAERGGEFIDNFLSMSRDEQDAMLDGWIDYMDANRDQIDRWRRSRPEPDPVTSYPTRFQRRMSYQSPESRAKFGELMNRFDQRCEDRNIKPVRMF